jgi:hypothetical protein
MWTNNENTNSITLSIASKPVNAPRCTQRCAGEGSGNFLMKSCRSTSPSWQEAELAQRKSDAAKLETL